MTIIEQVKALLGIEDNLRDNLLSVIQGLIPEKLNYIIVEVMVKRFNKLGSEGLSSQSVEGLSMSFDLDDFAVYDAVIRRNFAGSFQAGFKIL